ncbi:MAG: hypothetical protein ACJAS9_003988 [Polaribacter sp.]|jgi:hypothetical protein
MRQVKIIKQRACMVIFTLGLCLAGLHEMGFYTEGHYLIAIPTNSGSDVHALQANCS